jgi:hypothetical protein
VNYRLASKGDYRRGVTGEERLGLNCLEWVFPTFARPQLSALRLAEIANRAYRVRIGLNSLAGIFNDELERFLIGMCGTPCEPLLALPGVRSPQNLAPSCGGATFWIYCDAASLA